MKPPYIIVNYSMEVEVLSNLVDAEVFPLMPAEDLLIGSYCVIDHFDIMNTESSEEDDIDLCEENPLQ